MDGYELVASIREDSKYIKNNVPIIAITADAMEGQVKRCLDAGMDDYVAKPVHLAELQQVLGKWLSISTEEESTGNGVDLNSSVELTESLDDSDAEQIDSVVIDRSMLTQLVGDDPEKHQYLLNTFVDTTPEIIADIEAAFSERNAEMLVAHAHKLKSSARSMGAFKLFELCQTLEKNAANQQWAVLSVIVGRIGHAYRDVVGYVKTSFGVCEE